MRVINFSNMIKVKRFSRFFCWRPRSIDGKMNHITANAVRTVVYLEILWLFRIYLHYYQIKDVPELIYKAYHPVEYYQVRIKDFKKLKISRSSINLLFSNKLTLYYDS